MVKRYAFDIEILAVTYALGYKRIYEAPVDINFKVATITASSLWKIILLMLLDTTAVFYRLKLLRYYEKKSVRDESWIALILSKLMYPQNTSKIQYNLKKSKKPSTEKVILSK
jgi:hypothetical protein